MRCNPFRVLQDGKLGLKGFDPDLHRNEPSAFVAMGKLESLEFAEGGCCQAVRVVVLAVCLRSACCADSSSASDSGEPWLQLAAA